MSYDTAIKGTEVTPAGWEFDSDIQALFKHGVTRRRLTELYGAAAVERNVPAQEGPELQAPVVLSVSDHLIAALEDNPESDMVDLLTMTPLKDPVVMCTGYVVDRSTFFVDGRMRFQRCPFTREPLSEAVHPQVLLQRRLKDWKIGRLKLAADLAEGFLDKGEYAEAARTFDICTRYVVEDCDDAVYAQVISRIAALDGRTPSKIQPPLEALEWYNRRMRLVKAEKKNEIVNEAASRFLTAATACVEASDWSGAKEWMRGKTAEFLSSNGFFSTESDSSVAWRVMEIRVARYSYPADHVVLLEKASLRVLNAAVKSMPELRNDVFIVAAFRDLGSTQGGILALDLDNEAFKKGVIGNYTAKPYSYEIGDLVDALYHNGIWYPCSIKSRVEGSPGNPCTWEIAWDDGSAYDLIKHESNLRKRGGDSAALDLQDAAKISWDSTNNVFVWRDRSGEEWTLSPGYSDDTAYVWSKKSLRVGKRCIWQQQGYTTAGLVWDSAGTSVVSILGPSDKTYFHILEDDTEEGKGSEEQSFYGLAKNLLEELDVSELVSSLLQTYPVGPGTLSFAEAAALPGSVVLESQHPYAGSWDESIKVEVDGASSLYVAFDSRTRTERNYDWVEFRQSCGDKLITDKDGQQLFWAGKGSFNGTNYSGVDAECWPGLGLAPLHIKSGEFTLRFRTDGSGEDWGWRLVVWRAESYAKWTQLVKKRSALLGVIVDKAPYELGARTVLDAFAAPLSWSWNGPHKTLATKLLDKYGQNILGADTANKLMRPAGCSAWVVSGVAPFAVNWKNEKDEILFQLCLSESSVRMNSATLPSLNWEEEESVPFTTQKDSGESTLAVFAEAEGFNVAWGGNVQHVFKHRLLWSSYNRVEVDQNLGPAQITAVKDITLLQKMMLNMCMIRGPASELLKEITKGSPTLFEKASKLPGAIVCQSRHPYDNNIDEYTTVKFPGAKSFRIAFDPKTLTESCDFVQFLKGSLQKGFTTKGDVRSDAISLSVGSKVLAPKAGFPDSLHSAKIVDMVAEANLTDEQKDELRRLLPQAKRVMVNFGVRGWAVESVVIDFNDGSRQACGQMFDSDGKEMNLCDETSVKDLEGRTWTEVFEVPPGTLDLDTMMYEEFDYIVGIEGHGLSSTATPNSPAGLAYDLKFILASGSIKHVKGEAASDTIFRPSDVESQDASGQVLSWFQTPAINSEPTSMKLEVLCRDQGWGNQKGHLYARRVWTGGAGEWTRITQSFVPHTQSKLVLDMPVSQFTGRSQHPLQIELGFLVGSGGGHALYLSEAKFIISSPSARQQWKGRPFKLEMPREKIRSHTFKSIDFSKGTATGIQLHAPPPGTKYILEWDFAPQIDRLKDPDDIKLLDNVQDAAKWGEERYSGGSSWPGTDGVIAPLRINAEECTVRFYSDGSVVYWGWRFVLLPDSVSFYFREDPRFRLVEATLDTLPEAKLSLKQLFIPSIQMGATELSLWLLECDADREMQAQFSNWRTAEPARWRSLLLDDSQTAFVDGLIQRGWIPKESLQADGLLISALNLNDPLPMAMRLLEAGAGFKNVVEDLLRTPLWLKLVSSEAYFPLVKVLIEIPEVALAPVDVLVATIGAALKSKTGAIWADQLMVTTGNKLVQLEPAQQDTFKKNFVQSMLQPPTFDTLKDLENARFFESEHPYSHNVDEVTRVKIEDAKTLYVAFDPSTSMETGYDYVQVLTAEMNGFWGDEKYSGQAINFPGVAGGRKPVLRIDAAEFVVKFHTDHSGQDYGWRLVVVETLPQSPWAAVFSLMPVWADEHLRLLTRICDGYPEMKHSVMTSGSLLAAIESRNHMLAARLISYGCEIDDAVVNHLLKQRPMGLTVWQELVSYCDACDKSPDHTLQGYTPLRPSSLPVSFALKNSASGQFIGAQHRSWSSSILTEGGEAIAFSADVPNNGWYGLKSEGKYLSASDQIYLNDSSNSQFQMLLKVGTTDQVVVCVSTDGSGACYFKADGTHGFRFVKSDPTVYTIVSQGSTRFYPDHLAWSQICGSILEREAMTVRPDAFLSLQGMMSTAATSFKIRFLERFSYYLTEDQKKSCWKIIASELQKPQSVPWASGGLESLMEKDSSKVSFDKAASLPGAVVIESEHPYRSSQDEEYVVSIPGATALYVTFDERTQTENWYDYVQLLKVDGATVLDETWGPERYSGRESFPGVGGNEPLRLDGTNKFALRFHSDGSGNYWGWRAVVWAAEISSVVPSVWHDMLMKEKIEVITLLLSAVQSYKSAWSSSGFEEYPQVCELLNVAISPDVIFDLATHTSEDRRRLAKALFDSYGARTVSTKLREHMLEEDIDEMSVIKRLYLNVASYDDQALAQLLCAYDDVLKKHLSSLSTSGRFQTYNSAARGPYGALNCANQLKQYLTDANVKSGQVVSISFCSGKDGWQDGRFQAVAVVDTRLPSRGPLNLEFEFHELSSPTSMCSGGWDTNLVQEIISRRCVTYEDLVSVCCEEYDDAPSSTRLPQPKYFLMVWTCVPVAPEWRLPNERLIAGLSFVCHSVNAAERNYAHLLAKQHRDQMVSQGLSPDEVLVWACDLDLTRHLWPGYGDRQIRLTRVCEGFTDLSQPRSFMVKNVDGPFSGISGVYELSSWATPKRRAGAKMDGYWLIRKPDGNKWVVKLENTVLQFSSGTYLGQYTATFKCKGGTEYALEDVSEYSGSSIGSGAYFSDLPKSMTLSVDDGDLLTFTGNKDCPKISWYRMPSQPVYVNKKAQQYSIRRMSVEGKMRWAIVSSVSKASGEVLFLAPDYYGEFRPPLNTSDWKDLDQRYSARTEVHKARYFVDDQRFGVSYNYTLETRLCSKAQRLPRSSGSRSYVAQSSAAGIAMAGGPDYIAGIVFLKD